MPIEIAIASDNGTGHRCCICGTWISYRSEHVSNAHNYERACIGCKDQAIERWTALPKEPSSVQVACFACPVCGIVPSLGSDDIARTLAAHHCQHRVCKCGI